MVATWKTKLVDDIAKKVKSHKVVAVAGITNIPSKQLQSMRRKLAGEVEIVIARSNLIRRALSKAGVKGIDDYVDGPSTILLTNMNPFQLEKILFDSRKTAPAKVGSTAPFDLIVPKGDTGLPAGPVIGELQAAGIKAKIQGGKILVNEDSVVVKKGEKVSDKAAPVLARLGIEPMEILLKIKAAYESGMIYTSDILHIDPAKTVETISDAHRRAFNLAYNARVYNKATATFLVQEAASKARNLMINAKILNKETVGIYLARADAQAKALADVLPQELKAELDKKE